MAVLAIMQLRRFDCMAGACDGYVLLLPEVKAVGELRCLDLRFRQGLR